MITVLSPVQLCLPRPSSSDSVTFAPPPQPVEAAQYHRLAAGTAGGYGELSLAAVAAVVEGLEDLTVAAVGYHFLVAASYHHAVGAPGEGVRRAYMRQQLPLREKWKIKFALRKIMMRRFAQVVPHVLTCPPISKKAHLRFT